MKLTPIESSLVAAVGYLEGDGILLVRYHDGTINARPGFTADEYGQLMASPSKGKLILSLQLPLILIQLGPGKEVRHATRPLTTATAPGSAQSQDASRPVVPAVGMSEMRQIAERVPMGDPGSGFAITR